MDCCRSGETSKHPIPDLWLKEHRKASIPSQSSAQRDAVTATAWLTAHITPHASKVEHKYQHWVPNGSAASKLHVVTAQQEQLLCWIWIRGDNLDGAPKSVLLSPHWQMVGIAMRSCGLANCFGGKKGGRKSNHQTNKQWEQPAKSPLPSCTSSWAPWDQWDAFVSEGWCKEAWSRTQLVVRLLFYFSRCKNDIFCCSKCTAYEVSALF